MISTLRFTPVSQAAANEPAPEAAREITEAILRRWTEGETPDAAMAFAKHPELLRYKTLVLQLAYEEYCLRAGTTAPMTHEELVQRFPTYSKSLQRLVDIHEFFHDKTGEADEPTRWPAPGDQWLGYQLQEELGRGAFARVFLATEPALGGRLVVIKIARQDLFEAQALGRLEHPHVVPVFTVAKDPNSGLSGIVMPFLGRDTLADFLDEQFAEGAASTRQRLARPNTVLRMGVALGEALAYTHARGLLHQDLKPSNVLLTRDGRPMLLDFNLAAHTAGARRAGGTLPYMAPEQIELLLGRDVTVDERCDVFGLGVLLYELLTDELPFPMANARTPAAQLNARQHSLDQKALTGLRQVAGHRVATLIADCLAADPARRPQSANELVGRLRQLLAWPARYERWIGAHRWITAAAAASCLALLVTALIWFAVQPPAHVQAFRQGAWHYRNGEYPAAVQQFTLARAGGHPAATLARGRAHLRLGESDPTYLAVAMRDFGSVDEPNSNVQAILCRAQCMLRLGDLQSAAGLYRQALDKGASSPVIFNNLGVVTMELNKPVEAMQWYDKAISADPGLQIAYANRAVLRLRQALASTTSPGDAIQDVEQALKLGPPQAQLLRDAGLIHAVAARFDPAHTAAALDYLERAVDHGYSAASILKDVGFRAIASEARFLGLDTRPAPAAATRFARAIDVFDDEAFLAAHER